MKEKDEIMFNDAVLPEIKNTQNTNVADNITPEQLLEMGERNDLMNEKNKEEFIENLKDYIKSKNNFTPIKRSGSVTINKFGSAFKKERQRKNKEQRKSRKVNR